MEKSHTKYCPPAHPGASCTSNLTTSGTVKRRNHMLKRARIFLLLILAAIMGLAAGAALAQTPAASPAAQKAEQLYQAKDFAGAEKAYLAVTQSEPDNAFAWFRVATALQSLGQYEQSLPYLDKAEKAGYPAGAILYRRARVAAKMNDKDKAFDYLNQLAAVGFAQVDLLRNDADFADLKDDPRFAKAIENIQRSAHPCDFGPEYRQFDFWIGEWDVVSTQGQQPVGASSIQLILDKCVILENWTGGGGGVGRSFNIYNSTTKKWEQIWVDSSGGLMKFEGVLNNGVLDYYGDALAPNGAPMKRRLQFFNQGPEKVRQFSQHSADGGKTWQVEYDFTYLRKKSG
jgi:tetratricopeptide (TPR) repeat protein